MSRRSGRLSDIAQRTPIARSSKKRSRSESSDEETPRPTKIRGNGAKKNTTPKKSPHFTKRQLSDATGLTSEESSDGDEGEDESAYGSDAAATAVSTEDSPDDESESDFDSSDDGSKKRSAKKRKPTKANGGASSTPIRAGGKGEELWRPGVSTGVAPGTEVIIKKPKARPAGKTPYTPGRIHPNTLLFLGDLRRNNDRQWLKMHDPDFRQAENDFKAFLDVMTEKLIEVDDTVPELPVKDIIFRIYRDVRFSKDPTPYKAHFSAAWSRTGRKGPYACYYIHLEPGKSFLGGGSWHPEPQPLGRLRTNIDQHPEQLKNVLMNDRMRKEYLGGAPKVAQKVVKAFVTGRTNAENALKTRPQGYDKDHPDIALLRLRNFTLGRKLSDEEVVAPDFAEKLKDLMGVLHPFISYLNSIVMPDPEDDEASDDEDGDSEDSSEDDDEDDEDGDE